MEEGCEILPLPNNPTMAQMKRKAKVKACLSAAVSTTISRIMSLKTAKGIWDHLEEEYAGDGRIQGTKVLNLRRKGNLSCKDERV